MAMSHLGAFVPSRYFAFIYVRVYSSRTPPIVDFAANRVVCQTFAGYLPSFGAFGLAGALVLKFPIPGAYGTE